MRLISFIAGAAFAVSAAGSVGAQEWTFEASIYGWLPGLEATVDTPVGEVESSGGGSNLLENLDMTFMGTFETRNGDWGFILDVLYVDLSDDEATPFDLAFRDVQLETRMMAASGYALYRSYETPQIVLDAGLGFRTFSVDLDTKLTSAGVVEDRDFGAEETWTVPLLAARAIIPFNENWFATVYADAGATSEDTSTWQALATIGYRFNYRWSAQFGYRYMDIQKEIDGLDADLALGGPILGATYRF